MTNLDYQLKLAQLERAKGELRALCAIWYDASNCGGETYKVIKPMIEAFIETLSDHCG